ncbi:MAG: phosphoribosylglycinamide formyltransferase [Candidatus Binatia bacterium]|jgi:phosphoribosylglycinamide formyltransferase-1|nr:phosphoribosylglycinamide formyltransferase [Candidatus Binatia bacterium]MDG1957703.1 phosphoribosylglycinamide formyltransferase [Candidatus Binatia bacterium]MDG2010848.1 phosphoribosylglycinamide formyltransferase [Candidatus Binatia bacterium]
MKLGVLISGRGSNLRSIIDAVQKDRLNAEIVAVLSNRSDVEGLSHAAAAGIPCAVFPHGDFPNRQTFESAIVAHLKDAGADTIALAGFDRIVTSTLLRAFPNRVVNIHPALLPAFKGLHAQKQALEHGNKITGVTVHFVDEEMDHGPIIAQAAVAIEDGDTESTLAARILREEHRLYPEALQALASGQLRLDGRTVHGGPQ